MNIAKKIITLFCFSLFIVSAVSAGLEFKATSPEDVNGTISVADADSFHIDIWMDNTLPHSELCGGTFSCQLYSPDKSIKSVTHLMVPNGSSSTGSIEYLNDLKNSIFDVAAITIENGWGESGDIPHSIGNLPDSISFTMAGVEGLRDIAPDMQFIRLNLRADSPGTICIDSISIPGNDFWDWLFPKEWSPVTFNGPYCWEITSQVTDINSTSIDELPQSFDLSQNYPNPFNPSTKFELALPKASEWKITIYNVVGQKVDEFSGFHEAGFVEINWDAQNYSSGLYFYKAQAGDFAATRKMVLLK